MLTKTIKCKYCGNTIAGNKVCDDTQEKLDTLSRVLGTTSAVLRGNLFSAFRNASGGSQDSVKNITSQMIGGTLYHFDCPYCNQSFDKLVY